MLGRKSGVIKTPPGPYGVRRRASLAAALHMVVADTLNRTPANPHIGGYRALNDLQPAKQQSFDFLIRADDISRLPELRRRVRIGDGDDLHTRGQARSHPGL